MEREKDNIIIITDGDEPVPETEEAATDDLENDNIDDDTEEQALLELSYTDITDTADTTDETEKIDDTEETDKPQSKIPPRFVIISAAVSAAVIIAVAAAAYFIPKGDSAAQHGLDALRKSDETYLSASKKYNDAFAENRQLSEDLENKSKELEEFRAASDGLDKIGKNNEELEKTRDRLAKEAESKQREYDSLADISKGSSDRIVTLPSGYYTAGKDVPAGKYIVTGSGSVAVARSGKSIVNKLLDSEGSELELRDDDRIQIDGIAKFSPM